MNTNETVLAARDLVRSFGKTHAVDGLTLEIGAGEIFGFLGHNGAGKTTTLRTIMGLLVPRAGQITLEGQRIEGLATDRIVRLGIAQSPEGRRIFPRMSVLENLEMGAFARRDREQLPSDLEHVFQLFPRLKERLRQRAGTLSGGEQQMLAMGRALMARPKVLLLDEPSMGLAPLLVETIFSIIRTINAEGTTILLVEQNARMALQVAHRGYVLQSGEIVLHDTAAALLRSDVVRKSYLGEK